MSESDPNELSGLQFCGNCGAAVVSGAAACDKCGSRVQLGDDSPELSGGYVPYCRACGAPVAKEAAFNCPQCGMTPLCHEHYYPSSRTCALCPPFEASRPGEEVTAAPLRRPNGTLPQTAAAVPCTQCGARIRLGVEFCANCGADQQKVGEGSQYAGFLQRFGAFIIDNVILLIAGTILFAIVEIPALGLVITVPYYVIFTFRLGQTPGKRLLGLQVLNAEGDIPDFRQVLLRELVAKSVPSMLVLAGPFSVLFFIAGYITGTILLLGFLWIARDRRRRGFHDYFAGTFVVRLERRQD